MLEYIHNPATRNIMCGMGTTSYRLEIADEKWDRFKNTLSKNQTINDVIEMWIDERIEEEADD